MEPVPKYAFGYSQPSSDKNKFFSSIFIVFTFFKSVVDNNLATITKVTHNIFIIKVIKKY